MSNKEELEGIHHPSRNDGQDTKRKQQGNGSDDCNKQQQKKRKRENDLVSSLYKGMSFHKRISTGRPGTPHRYFDTSYDVIEEIETTNDSSTQSTTSNYGCQLVHRHLNGLCIVTAGNILERSIAFPPQKIADNDDYDEDQNKNVEISKIKYLVKASKDSQSARGKMRVKKKKKKHANTNTSSKEGDGNNPAESVEGDHDGTVSPHTPLCRITLSNGKVVQLKCCVEGTVIETNHLFKRLTCRVCFE